MVSNGLVCHNFHTRVFPFLEGRGSLLHSGTAGLVEVKESWPRCHKQSAAFPGLDIVSVIFFVLLGFFPDTFSSSFLPHDFPSYRKHT